MTPTPADVRAELLALLDVSLDSVDAVYDHESNLEQTGPCYVTVDLERITPTDQVWAVRIYSQAADGIEDAAHRLDAALVAVDDQLKTAPYGPSTWDVGYSDDLGAKVARCFIDVGRETF